jgi:hypothetical protein
MRSDLGQLVEQLIHGGVLWLTGLFLIISDIHTGFQIVGIFLAVLGIAVGLGLGKSDEE